MSATDWQQIIHETTIDGQSLIDSFRELLQDWLVDPSAADNALKQTLQRLQENNWSLLKQSEAAGKDDSLMTAHRVFREQAAQSIDWQAIIFSPQQYERLDTLARKKIWDDNLAFEAKDHILQKWQESDWKKLKTFQGRSKPSTFLTTVYNSALIDRHRELFGRCEPKTWIKKLGSLWSKIFKKLCCEVRTEQEISDRLSSDEHSPAQVREICQQILQRDPHCQAHGTREETGHFDQTASDALAESASLEAGLMQEETQYFIDVLGHVLGFNEAAVNDASADDPPPKNTAVVLPEQLDISLSDEEIIVLRLVYHSNLKIPKAAVMMGKSENQVRYIHKCAVEKLASSRLLNEAVDNLSG